MKANFILKRMPIPPTANRTVMPSHGRLVKTPEYRRYEDMIGLFKLRNIRSLAEIEHEFKDKLVRIDTYFVFAHKRIFTKKNQLKMIDASNRIKICHDAISKCINIDDKFFVTGFFEKMTCENEKDEQVILKFSHVENVRDFNELFKECIQCPET